MKPNFLLEDKGESIRDLVLENSFFKDTIKTINNLNPKQLEIFFKVVFQLGDHGVFQYVLNKLTDEKIRSEIVEESSCFIKEEIQYRSLDFAGFKVGDKDQDSSPANEVLRGLRNNRLKNRGVSKNSHGNYQVECNTFAKYLLKRLLIVRKNEEVYAYNQGVYEPLEEIELRKVCREILSEVDDTIWKVRFEREYIDALKMELDTFDSLNSTKNLIAFKNGIFDLLSGNFCEFSSKHFFTSKLDYNYDSEARAPRFERFLEEVFENDQERIGLMEEILGYFLMEDRRIHKMYVFKGSGSNGKSVLNKIIESLLGLGNISNTPLNKLEGRFGLQNLEGKLVNISSENELGEKNIDTENIKAITGGDRVEVEKKNQDSYSVELYTRLVISVNNDFSFSDTSYGILRRLLFVPFNVRFHEKTFDEDKMVGGRTYQDSNLLSELLKELSGIFNIAYRGLERLRDNGFVFTQSKVCNAELERYIQYSDPIAAFIGDELEVAADLQITKPEINRLFNNWQKEHGGQYKRIVSNKAATLVEEKLEELSVHVLEKKVNGHRTLEGVGIRGRIKNKEKSSRKVDIPAGGQDVLAVI